MAIHRLQGPDGKIHRIEAPENVDPRALEAFLASQLRTSVPSDLGGPVEYGLGALLSRGVSRGFSRLGSTITDTIPALAGAALGFDDYAREQLAEAEEKEAALRFTNPAQYQSFRDVEGISDVPGFVLETIGEQAANLLPGLAGGLGAGAIGARSAAAAATRGIAEKEARDAALKQAAGQITQARGRGQVAGAFAGSYALNAPEVFQNIYEETGQIAPGAAAGFGTAAAALDSILPAQIARSLSGPMKVGVTEALLARAGMERGFLRKLAAGALGGAAVEGPTEAAQEAISIAAERFVAENSEAFTEREIERIKESFVRGSVAGGGLSTAGSIPEGIRESAAAAAEKTQAEAPTVGDDLTDPQTSVSPTEPIEPPPSAPAAPTTTQPVVEDEVVIPEPTVRSQSVAPAQITPRAREILRRMGYTEAQIDGFNQNQAEAIIEETDPEMLDYLDEIVPLPEDTSLTPAPAPAFPQTLDERKALARQFGLPASLIMFSNNGVFAAYAGQDMSDPTIAQRFISEAEEAGGKLSASNREKLLNLLDTFRPTGQTIPTEDVVDDIQTAISEEAKPTETEDQTSEPSQVDGVEAVAAEAETGQGEATQENLGVKFESVPQGEKARVLRSIPLPDSDLEIIAALPETTLPKKGPLTGEQAAAAFFAAYEPASALRVMVAEGVPTYTESQTVPTEEDARRATKWVKDNLSEDALAAMAKHAEDFSKILSRTQVTAKKRAVRDQIDDADAESRALKEEQETTKKVDAALRRQEAKAPSVAPKKLDAATREALKEIDRRAAQETESLTADTAVGRTQRSPEKAEQSRKIESQAKMFELTGGKVEELPYTGPETVRWGKYYLENAANSPKLEGDLLSAVQAGNLKQAISQLINKTSGRPEVQQILRRIQGMGLKTKIVVGELGRPGEYDPVTDTITLDPELGLNEHTLIHELTHAALANRIADKNSKEAKEFTKFFAVVQNQLGSTYGATDVQEFAAEIMGNEEFAAALKSMKAPRSGTLLQRIVQAIAEFLGFRKGQSVYSAGIRYINDLLNVPESAEPTLTQKLFMGTPNQAAQALSEVMDAAKGAPKATLKSAKDTIARLSKEGGAAHMAYGFLNFQNIQDLFATGNAQEKEFAKNVKRMISRPVLQRMGEINSRSARVSEQRQKFPSMDANPTLMERAHKVAAAAREAGINLLPESTQKLTTAQEKIKQQLQNQLNSLPKEYREMYYTMRRDYDQIYDEIQSAMELFLKDDAKALAEMKERFSAETRNFGYVPFSRFGDLQVYYQDPVTGKDAMDSFETIAERDAFIKAAGLKKGDYYEKRKDQNLSGMGNRIPPSYFIGKLQEKLRENGATEDMLGDVRELYLSMFPASSLATNFIKAKNTPGMSKDMPRVHADFMMRAIKQLANLKYGPQINEGLNLMDNISKDASNYDPNLRAAALNIAKQRDFLNNPTYNGMVNFLSTGSYVMNLAANMSAAAVNTTSLAVLTFPILSAKYQAGEVISAMAAAGKIAGGKWGEGKYKKLHDFLNAHGQLTHTMARELTEASRTKSGDSQSLSAKLIKFGSIPFTWAEQYARATTAISAYELAKNNTDLFGRKLTDAQAMEYALETVIRANTPGTAAASPRYMQTDWGRVILTFKSFNLNGSFVAARGLWEAIKNEDPDIRRAAIRQSTAMFGVAGTMGGVMGLPFMGVATTFADIIGGLANLIDDDDDDYFSAEMMARENLGRLLAYGPVDYLTGTAIGRRTVLTQDLIFRDDPRTMEEQGLIAMALKQALGPMGAYAIDTKRAFDDFSEGRYARGAEQLLPSAGRNVVKGLRYMSDGAVLARNGDVITTDISSYAIAKQMLGFSPSNLADLYDRRNEAMQFTKKISDRKQRLLDVAYAARNSGDMDTLRKAEARLQALGVTYPGLVNRDTLSRSFKARDAAMRDSINGLRFPKWSQQEVRDRFMLDDD